MKSSILTIGDELLLGQVTDTNSAWLGRQMFEIGMPVGQILSVADEREAIMKGLRQSGQESQVVIITGGLGPTPDDITRKVLSEFFDKPLVHDEQTMAHVKGLFDSMGVQMAEVNKGQAMVIEGCRILHNPFGTAPGMYVEQEDLHCFILPGVPFEMKNLFTTHIAPILKSRFALPAMVHTTALIEGIGESSLMEKITDWEQGLKDHGVSLAYLPSPGRVRLRLLAKGPDRKALTQNLDDRVEELIQIVPEFYKGRAGEEPEVRIGRLLNSAQSTVATAESCTGGTIAQQLTSIPGASAYFKGAVVAYANEVKQQVLGVSGEDLEKYGAVSQQVVEQMAHGVREKLNVDYAMATSGIAGPDGGTDEKPVGTVWMAIATPHGVQSQRIHAGRSREQIIARSARKLIAWLADEIECQIGL